MHVAFIGLGTMGAAMAANLLKAGFPLTVHNRTREKETPLAGAGAVRAASPGEAAQASDVVLICVSDTPDVEAVVLGENGIIQGVRAGSVVVDMSTISPSATRRMAAKLAEKGAAMIDAPVSGGSEGARKGTLSIMMGGDAGAVTRVRPVMEAMGATIGHIGPVGAGQVTKAINQIVIAGTYWGVAEEMVLGLKAGLDMDKVVDAVSGGAAGSWGMTHRSGNMIADDYPLGFRMRLHRKDLIIALEVARDLGVSLPVAALVEQAETGLIGQGFGDEDVSAIARSLRRQSGIDSTPLPRT